MAGRAANENDLFGIASVDEATDSLARTLESIGRALAQRVDATVHVRMVVLVVLADRVDQVADRDGIGALVERGRELVLPVRL